MLVLVADQAQSTGFTGTGSCSVNLILCFGHDRSVACDCEFGSVSGHLASSTTGMSSNPLGESPCNRLLTDIARGLDAGSYYVAVDNHRRDVAAEDRVGGSSG